MARHVCNATSQEAETRGIKVQRQPGLIEPVKEEQQS